MKSLSLIGKEISHSKSQEVYEQLLQEKISYKLIDVSAFPSNRELLTLFNEVDGISITAPYKEDAYKSADRSLTPFPFANALRFRNGKIEAHCTDAPALLKILESYKEALHITEFALLGDGAMATLLKSCAHSLQLEVTQFSRRLKNLIDPALPSFDLVVNATARSFHFTGKLKEGATFWDLNYEMDGHQFSTGINYHDGKELLKAQAEVALQFFYEK